MAVSPEELLAHGDWVRRLARMLVASGTSGVEAADVEQETWQRALARPPEHRGNLRGWFAAIVRSVVQRRGRDEATRARHERAAAAATSTTATTPAVDEVVERARLQKRVVEAVLALDEPYRSTLLLRFFDELPPGAIADRTGAPVETVKTRLKRGLAQVRQRLSAELGADGADWIAALAPLLAPRSVAAAGASSTAGGAGIAGVAGLMMGGALVSKFGKSLVAGVAALVALLGTYVLWIAPQVGQHDGTGSARDGSSLPALAAVEAPQTPPLPAVVEATREPAAPTTAAAAVVPTAPPPLLATIEGTLRDRSGSPVAGAQVVLERPASSPMWDASNFLHEFRRIAGAESPQGTARSTTSAADGSFRFDALDPQAKWAIGVVHDPLGTGWSEPPAFTGTPPCAKVTIVLTPGVVLFGTVHDSAGRPIANAGVFLQGRREPPAADEPGVRGWHFIDGVIGDAEGNYRSLPLPWRQVTTSVHVRSRPDLATVERPMEELPPGVVEVRRDFVVPALATLTGRILGLDGLPAQLARTVVPRLGADASRPQSRSTIVVAAFAEDPRGRPGLIEGLDAGGGGGISIGAESMGGTLAIEEDRYQVELRSAALRYVAVVARGVLLGVAEIPQPIAPTDLVIDPSLLPEQSLIHGLRLHFRQGGAGRPSEPLAGVFVFSQAMRRMTDGRLEPEIVNFGGAGTPPPDQELELPLLPQAVVMSRDGFVTRTCLIDPSRPGAPTELTIEFTPAGGSLAVEVEDEEGHPAPGIEPRLYRLPDLEPVVSFRFKATDERGACRLADLPAGELLVIAEAEGFVPAAARVTVASAEEPVLLVLERGYEMALRPRLKIGALATAGQFVVTTEEGVPLYDCFHPRTSFSSSAAKTVRLVDGRYSIRYSLPAGPSARTEFIAAPGATIDLLLEPHER